MTIQPKISHEVPFSLLEKSLEFNDFQYCLPHLMESNEQYRKHFLKCKEEGVEIYLDNSLHELGYAMEDSILIKWMEILEPSTFFIPDVWEDYKGSLTNAQRWADIEVPKGVTKCAIVQAKNLGEARECTMAYKNLGYEKIAYSYGASYYNDLYHTENQDFGKGIGRWVALTILYNEDVLTSSDRIHLLGTAYPLEFCLYQHPMNIESIDTSNPIMAGIEGMEYTDEGLDHKPKANMNNFADMKPTKAQLETIEFNVAKFREINGFSNGEWVL